MTHPNLEHVVEVIQVQLPFLKIWDWKVTIDVSHRELLNSIGSRNLECRIQKLAFVLLQERWTRFRRKA